MKNQRIYSLLFIIIAFTTSCSNDDIKEPTIQNLKSVTDCDLSTNPEFTGICMNGATSVFPNEILTYASKSTANFSEILWSVESGNIEILNIEYSIVEGLNKSIATIKFNFDFSEGSIGVKTINDSGELSEISLYKIELENNQ